MDARQYSATVEHSSRAVRKAILDTADISFVSRWAVGALPASFWSLAIRVVMIVIQALLPDLLKSGYVAYSSTESDAVKKAIAETAA